MITNADSETLQSFLNSMQTYNMDDLKSLGLNFDHGLTATADPNMLLSKRSSLTEEPELTPMQPSTPQDQRVPTNPPGPSTSPNQVVVAKRSQAPATQAPPNGKKTKGRVKIKMEFINNKLRRYTTFSKRKTGIMKKAYELSTLTGTQVMLLVASETGHVYTFATRKLQPMITSESGKQLIQTCLNSPDENSVNPADQRMAATGYEETDLSYNILNQESSSEDIKAETSGSEDEGESEESNPHQEEMATEPGCSTGAIHEPSTSTQRNAVFLPTVVTSTRQSVGQAVMLPNGTILITEEAPNRKPSATRGSDSIS